MHAFFDFTNGDSLGWILVGISTALITITVFVLSRLRGTQARPIASCVVLSVVAHFVLIGAAYLTRYFDIMPSGGDDAIAVRFVDDAEVPAVAADTVQDGIQKQQPQSADELVPDWDRLAIDPVEIELPAPERIDVLEQTPEVDEVAASEPSDERLAAAAPVVPPADSMMPTATQTAKPYDWRVAPNESESLAEHQPPKVASNDTAKEDDLVATAQPQSLAAAPTVEAAVDAELQAASVDQLTSTAAVNQPVPTPTAVPPANTLPSPAASTSTPNVPKRYRSRVATDVEREQIARRRGGSRETEAAVRQALKWLANNQSPDGRWDASQHGAGSGQLVEGATRGPAGIEADTGISGLALLALLGSGHTHRTGKHRRAVARGLEFLLRQQQSSGSLAGNATGFARMYCHGIASLALAEAYAMTGDQRLRPFTQRAIDYSVAAQHPYTGGWRYNPGDTGDTSQFGWQLMALSTAEVGGIRVPTTAKQSMRRFLNSVTTGTHGGLASYRPRHAPTRSMTAEALVCRVFMGKVDAQAEREAAEFIMQQLPGSGQPNLYYWYYATLGLSQSKSDSFSKWNRALVKNLTKTQRRSGKPAGSWDPVSVWAGHGGRVYSTALSALCLESYYRYSPAERMELAGRRELFDQRNSSR